MSQVSKIDEPLKEIIVSVANDYGGFMGFEPEEREYIVKAKQKLLSIILEALPKNYTLNTEYSYAIEGYNLAIDNTAKALKELFGVEG